MSQHLHAVRELLSEIEDQIDGLIPLFGGRVNPFCVTNDAPTTRVVQGPEGGEIVEIRQVGGLHHRYERRTA